MKKTGKLLLSVLLVLTMVLSGFAAGGAGGLRVSADSDSIVVEEGQQSVALPDRGPKDGHDFLGWKNVTTGEIIEAGKQVTGPVTLIPVWEKDADEEDDEKDDEENDYDEFEPEDASSEEDLLTGGEDGFEGEGAALTDEEDGEGEDPTTFQESFPAPCTRTTWTSGSLTGC